MDTQTLLSTGTTFVSSTLANTNLSSSALIIVGTDPIFANCISFLKFKIPPLPVVSVDSAVLRLFVFAKTGAPPSPIVINRVTSPFDTATVTYNTMPSYIATASMVQVTSGNVLQYVEINVTALVNQWLNGTFVNYGIALTNTDGTTAVQLGGKLIGVSYEPQLILNYSVGPIGPTGPTGPTGATGPSFLTGVGAPTCGIGEFGEAYIDLNFGQTYYKLAEPVPPPIRAIPSPTGNTLLVGATRTYTTIDAALAAASDGDRLLLDAETFDITATINVDKSVTIEGQGMALTTVITTTPSVVTMFNITVSGVIIRDMKIVQNYPATLSVETVIGINNWNTGIYIDGCEISVCEIGIGIKAVDFQITNCHYTYAPLASPGNGYFYNLISSTTGESIIANNTFVSDSGATACRFIIITNVSVSSGILVGKLFIGNNTQVTSPFTLRHLLVIEEFVGFNFALYINNNTTILEGNVPVLLFNADFGIFNYIEVDGNAVQNTAGKGLIGIDGSSTRTTNVYASNNTIVNQFFTTGWATATVPASFIVGYNTEITPAPVLPLESCYWLPLY